jgi:hypothetical protein
VIFSGPGVSLAYRGLVASDALGRQLPARIELRGDRLLLRIDDRGARYPVRVDPFVQQAKLTASDGAPGDELGSLSAVAVSGDTVVAGGGARRATYVFVKPAAGWADETQAAKLTTSDGGGGDILGFSVAVDGDTVVAGAPDALRNGKGSLGEAYVFVKPAGGWADETEAAKLTASDGVAFDNFGIAVGVSGDTVVAGAPKVAASPQGQGAVYVFRKPAGGWADETEQEELTASDGAAGNELGISAGVSGDTVVAGAPDATVNGNANQGAAYVFGILNSTSTAVNCSPNTVAVGHSTKCTATVTDTAANGQRTPTGTVSFTSSGPGAFSPNQCTLSQASPGVASCSVTYTPGPSGALRSDTITASYGGDSTHTPSGETTTVKVQPTSEADCKKDGWKNYGFRNQGQCIKFVNHGERGGHERKKRRREDHYRHYPPRRP